MPNRRAEIKKNLSKAMQGRGPKMGKAMTGLDPNAKAGMQLQKLGGPSRTPRFGGPQGGRPTLRGGQIKALGIQPANKREGKRRYLGR